MRRGFKTAAKKLALEVRGELELSAYDVLDPYGLAKLYGIRICPIDALRASGTSAESLKYFMKHRPQVFDAAVVPAGNGCFIIENVVHALTRRRATISHEMAHIVLEHEFTATLVNSDGCRTVKSDIEDEATWLGGELLIPYEAALAAARAGKTDAEVAEEYNVSVRLAAMRMNASGARTVAERERRYRRR